VQNSFENKKKINELFDFAPDEGEARSKFRRLALDTYDYFAPSVGFMWPFSPVPQFAQSDIDHWTGLQVPMPPDLQERWHAWRAEWPGLLERNPKVELYLAIKALAYSFRQNSWMNGFEGRLQDWVDSGERLPIPLGPLQDPNRIVRR